MSSVFPEEVEDALRREAKRELRKSMQRMRAFMSASLRAAASERIRARLREARVYEGVRAMASFAPIEQKGEPSTQGLHDDARALGITVAYPAIGDDGVMLFRASATMPTEEQGRGFPEPALDAAVVPFAELDLVIVPGLAFDPEGFRIGYGAGFYDRALPSCTRARKVGVAFDVQIVIEVPARPFDVPVDLVVTDKRSFEREKKEP